MGSLPVLPLTWDPRLVAAMLGDMPAGVGTHRAMVAM